MLKKVKSIRSYLTIAMCSLLLLFGIAACNQQATNPSSPTAQISTLQSVTASSKIKVGYLVFPPTITKNQTTGELGGHMVDTIKEIARLNKWTPEFIETDFAGFTSGLDAKRFDMTIVPTFVTVPRALSVYFTRPLLYAGNSAITKAAETRFTTLESIDQPNINIAVTQGEAGDEYATANFKKAKITRFPGGDQSLAFQAVVAGRADIALGDAYVTTQFAKANPQVKDLFADKPYNLTPVSWAVRKGDNEMLNFLNSSIDTLDIQGHLREYEQKAGANWLHLKKTWEFTKS
jgi:ABC-type amino acid transport substrate-binding protein